MPLSEVATINGDSSLHGQPVKVKALVTYSDPDWHLLFVADQGLGLYIDPPAGLQARPGDVVLVEGKAASFNKGIEDPKITILSRNNPLPSPLRVPAGASLTEHLSQWAEVSGILRWASPSDRGVTLQLACGDHDCPVHVHRGNMRDLPPIGARISVAGVLAAQLDTQGKVSGVQIFSPSMQQVRLLSRGPENPFSLPLSNEADLKGAAQETMVRVAGQLQSRTGGATLEMGTLSFPVTSIEPLHEGTYRADVVGFWTRNGIKDAIVHSVSEEPPQSARIRTISELKGLTSAEASMHRRVAIRGVVTYSDPAWGLLFVQDETGAAFVDAHGLSLYVKSGDVVDVTGVSSSGDFAPSIDKAQIVLVRRGVLPTPAKVGRPEVNFAKADSQWTTVEGVVHSAHRQNDHTMLKIGSGRTTVNVELPMMIRGDELVDRKVSATGAFGILFNDRRQAIGYQIFSPSPSFIKVLQNNTRADAVRAVNSLQKYEPNLDDQHSVVLNGVVVLKSAPDVAYIQDSTGGIQVRGVGALNVSDGDLVSVRGFVVPGDYSPILEDAVVMKRERGALPEPPLVPADDAATGKNDSQFIRIRGVVNDIRTNSSGTTLGLVSYGLRYEATGPDLGSMNSLRPGSTVEIRGICQVLVDRFPLSVRGFTVLFDSPGSITVLKAGPWWTARRIAWALMIIFAGALGVFSWAAVLRRKVRSRTRELQDSLQLQRNSQQFDQDRNAVLETIAANQPLRVSLEKLATAAAQQIRGAACAVYMTAQVSADGSITPAMLIASDVPEAAQQSILPVLNEALPDTSAEKRVVEPGALAGRIVEAANAAGQNLAGCQIEPVLRGTGMMAGLVIVLFERSRPAELAPLEQTALLSVAHLVSIAHEHSDLHQRLLHDAYHDPLTELPNRTLAEDRLEHALALSERLQRRFTVLCIDLDNFKTINDRFGHLAGDEVLRIISARFRSRIRKSDTIARVGGDEFIAILEESPEAAGAFTFAQSLASALREPLMFDGRNMTLAASIGIAVYPQDGDTVTALKRHADHAMYTAKANGGDQICFWSSESEAEKNRDAECLDSQDSSKRQGSEIQQL